MQKVYAAKEKDIAVKYDANGFYMEELLPCLLYTSSRRSKKWYNTVMFGFVFSLMLETLQLVFKVGSFDVDDMLLNTLGAAAGYLCYRLVQWTRCKLRKRRLSR